MKRFKPGQVLDARYGVAYATDLNGLRAIRNVYHTPVRGR
jgi:hypothetical protein